MKTWKFILYSFISIIIIYNLTSYTDRVEKNTNIDCFLIEGGKLIECTITTYEYDEKIATEKIPNIRP